jgi:hypothetical protein
MNILIEDAVTLEFLAGEGRWTNKPDKGASFPSTRAALATARQEPIDAFNIVLCFGENKQLINMDRGTGKGKLPSPSN